MRSVMWRESPLPVLMALAALLGFIEYLHWSIVRHEDRAQIVLVPASFSGAQAAVQAGALSPMEPAPGPASPVGETPAVGPMHAEARSLAAAGRVLEALQRLEASLASEGKPDAVRLEERGVLLLRLGRSAAALAELGEAERLGMSSAAHYFNAALARAQAGDTTGAESEYQRALTLDPRFGEVWNNLGLLLMARGDRDAAIEALSHAVDLLPPASRLQPMLALAELEGAIADGREVARGLYRQAIQMAPADPAGHFGLGALESRAGELAAAEKEYRAALDIQASYTEARYNLALLLLESGRAAEAMRHLEVLARGGASPRVAFGLGRAHRALGNEAEAEAAYKEAIRLAGGRYPEAFFNLGLLLRAAGRDKEAEAAYRQTLLQNPNYAAAWINLALLLDDLKRPAEALEAAEKAVAANARNEKAWFLRGRLLSAAGRGEEALAAYTEAMRLRPGYTKAMLNAAVLHAEAGRNEQAIALYRQVLAVDPRNAAAWFNLGIALGRSGREDEARGAYEEALRADPEATGAAQNLGVLYARQGRIEDARRTFGDALERHPDDVGLRFNLALQLEKLGKLDEATRTMERVVHLDPGHSRAWTVLARLQQALGRSDEARRARAKAAEVEARAPARLKGGT